MIFEDIFTMTGPGSCLMTGPAVFTPLCSIAGDVIGAIRGDGDIRCGWEWEMGDRGGKLVLIGEV